MALIQILVVADTLIHPGALLSIPSVWLHLWTQEPDHGTWEGVQSPLELSGACQGVWWPPTGLGMLVAGHPQVPAAWHLGHLTP